MTEIQFKKKWLNKKKIKIKTKSDLNVSNYLLKFIHYRILLYFFFQIRHKFILIIKKTIYVKNRN